MKISLTTVLVFGCIAVFAQRNNFYDIGSQFTPAGYMGCNKSIVVEQSWTTNPHSGPICFRISTTNVCDAGYAGVYWTNRADVNGANWGQYQGANLSSHNYTRLTFWARGEYGGEMVKFGTGGINNTDEPAKFKYRDSFHKVIDGGFIALDKKWKQYSIDIRKQDLSSVIGGFYWVANWTSDGVGVIFYLDDIRFER